MNLNEQTKATAQTTKSLTGTIVDNFTRTSTEQQPPVAIRYTRQMSSVRSRLVTDNNRIRDEMTESR